MKTKDCVWMMVCVLVSIAFGFVVGFTVPWHTSFFLTSNLGGLWQLDVKDNKINFVQFDRRICGSTCWKQIDNTLYQFDQPNDLGLQMAFYISSKCLFVTTTKGNRYDANVFLFGMRPFQAPSLSITKKYDSILFPCSQVGHLELDHHNLTVSLVGQTQKPIFATDLHQLDVMYDHNKTKSVLWDEDEPPYEPIRMFGTDYMMCIQTETMSLIGIQTGTFVSKSNNVLNVSNNSYNVLMNTRSEVVHDVTMPTSNELSIGNESYVVHVIQCDDFFLFVNATCFGVGF
jgi:hypothetical protein